jgi:hypothetical protein
MNKSPVAENSVADPGCLSRIPDPDFYPSRIPDPGSRIPDPKTGRKERGEKKILSNIFLLQQISQNVKLFNF